jgi:hypothetical protein
MNGRLDDGDQKLKELIEGSSVGLREAKGEWQLFPLELSYLVLGDDTFGVFRFPGFASNVVLHGLSSSS